MCWASKDYKNDFRRVVKGMNYFWFIIFNTQDAARRTPQATSVYWCRLHQRLWSLHYPWYHGLSESDQPLYLEQGVLTVLFVSTL